MKLKAFTCLAIIPDCWLIMCARREVGEGENRSKNIFFLGVLDKPRYFLYKNLDSKRLLAGK